MAECRGVTFALELAGRWLLANKTNSVFLPKSKAQTSPTDPAMRSAVAGSVLVLLCAVGLYTQFLFMQREVVTPALCRTPGVLRELKDTTEVIVRTTTDPAFKISLHSRRYDEVRWRITENGTYYDGCLTSAARSVLHNAKPGLVVDVGANIGWLSLYALAMGHRVIACVLSAQHEISPGAGSSRTSRISHGTNKLQCVPYFSAGSVNPCQQITMVTASLSFRWEFLMQRGGVC